MTSLRPVLMGAVMAPMLLWMIHGALAAGSFAIGWTVLAFVGAHVIAFGALAGIGIWAAKRNAKVAAWLNGRHRPSLSHARGMLVGAVGCGALIHLGIHGGVF